MALWLVRNVNNGSARRLPHNQRKCFFLFFILRRYKFLIYKFTRLNFTRHKFTRFYADTNFLFTNLPIVQWIQFIHWSKSTDLSQNLSLNQFSNSDRGNSHVGGKTSFVFESVFKSCKPSVQAFRFIKCLPVTFVHVKSSEVKLIKPNVVVLQI